MSGSQQAAPRGMQRLPFPLDSYTHESLPLSAKRLINVCSEQAPDDARTKGALISTTGLQVYLNVGTGPIVALCGDYPGVTYVVSGTRAYRIRFLIDGTTPIDDLGDVGSPSIGSIAPYRLMVTIAADTIGAVICVPPNAFTCTHSGSLNQLGGTFPGNATSVAYVDGYYGFTSSDAYQKFFISHLLDPTNFDALDFAYADAMPNNIYQVISHRGEFWLLGDNGHEVWYDAGQADFPFRRRAGGVSNQGGAGPRSTARGDGSVFWVGYTDIVFRSNGYVPQRISTHPIEQIIRAAGSAISVQSAFTYIENGHIYYVLNLPLRTLVYDCATQTWHERSSSPDGSGRWVPDKATYVADHTLFGASNSSKIYIEDAAGAEEGRQMLRQFTMPPLYAGTRRAFCSRLEVEMDNGHPAAGNVTLDWSNDGGYTFLGGPRAMVADPATAARRVVTNRLGSFRQRVYRVSCTGKTTFYAVDADIQAGVT